MGQNPGMQVSTDPIADDQPADRRPTGRRSGEESAGRRPRARRGEGDRLRAEIVAAASAILAETGEPAELSLRAVARAVGVAATSIYIHFSDLGELILAVKEDMLARFGEVLDTAAAVAGDDPQQRVRARAHAYYDFGLRNPGVYQVMFSSQMVSTPNRPAYYIGRPVFERVRDDVAAALGESGPAAELAAVHLWTALHGTITLRLSRRNFPWPDLDTQLEDLIDRLLNQRR
jgi:AcrR family transcriptional regulator